MSRTSRLQIIGAAVLASLAAWAGASAAAREPYVGAAIGRADFQLDTTGAAAADTKDTGYKLFGGTMLTPNFGVEAAVFDLGQARGTATLPGIGSVAVSGQARGISLAALAALPLGDAALFAKAGFAQVRGEVQARTPTVDASESSSSLQPVFGVGASYAFTPSLEARIEWERIRVRYAADLREDAEFVSAGLSYRF